MIHNFYFCFTNQITSLDEFEDGQSYVCLCNNENFKKMDYTSSPLGQNNKTTNRLTRSQRPASPLKVGLNGYAVNVNGFDKVDLSERDSVVHPRIVTLIRSGTKPRKIHRLLLNKRNSHSFEHVLTAITQCVKLDTGCVRKVYTLLGTQLQGLADFFGEEYVFFAYGTERVNADDFKLEVEEMKAVQQTRKTLRTGSARSGPKPQMPTKNSVNLHNTTFEYDDDTILVSKCDDSNPLGLPEVIQNNYILGPVIGDGNFAVVLKIKRKNDKKNFALKIIDKSKCKGKEHYIDAEIRVMKKLQHEQVMALHMNFDTPANMFLILEYVSGGDLFDAITRVTRFPETEARLMIKHLASAMAYLHSLSIVHRDIKPENLLVELDESGHITQLKLADFGLACEVVEPLTAVCGTPTYVAPEILMETGYGLKVLHFFLQTPTKKSLLLIEQLC